MNVRSKNGVVTQIKLLQKEREILASAQGICAIVARNLGRERVGELAATAEKALDELRDILLAAEPVALVPAK